MKKFLTVFIVIGFLLVQCKKESIKQINLTDPDFETLVIKYNLKLVGSNVNLHPIYFYDLNKLEIFLKKRIVNVINTKFEKVDKTISYTLNSSRNYNNTISLNPPPPKLPPPCHNANMNFQDTWNKPNYDGGTGLNIQVNYGTNNYQLIQNITVNALPYGSTPDQFGISNMQTSNLGDNISITFNTTQTNVLNIGGINFNNTTVTNWTINLNTCNHTQTTSYNSSPPL